MLPKKKKTTKKPRAHSIRNCNNMSDSIFLYLILIVFKSSISLSTSVPYLDKLIRKPGASSFSADGKLKLFKPQLMPVGARTPVPSPNHIENQVSLLSWLSLKTFLDLLGILSYSPKKTTLGGKHTFLYPLGSYV